MLRRNLGLVLACSSALTMVAPAWAIDADAPAANDEASVADIVVTARRIEERLQDVPISITVYNQQQLTNRNIFATKDIATYTPSLQANSRFGSENTTFAIRGFTQELRTQPSVAVYFADVVAPRGGGTTQSGDGAGPGSLFDLQNVQILKGPQGTLFGRNTTGGAVLLVPQKPTSQLGGYVEGSAGNHDMRRLQAVLNAPLGERARFRIGFDRQVRDGYLHNLSGIGPKDFADVDYWAARASLVVDLTPTLETYTIASYVRSDTNGQTTKLGSCYPTSGTRLLYGGEMSCAQIAREAGKGYYAVESGIANPQLFLEQWQLINTTSWKATDTLTVKNIVSYAQLVNRLRSENFGTYWVIPTGTLIGRPTGAFAGQTLSFARSSFAPNTNSADQSTFTEELQFQGTLFEDRLSWQAGGYLEASDPLGDVGGSTPANLVCTDQDALQCTDVLRTITGSTRPVGLVTYFKGRTAYRNLGAYAQGSYRLGEKVKLTAGIRYSSDRTRSSAQKIFYSFPAPNTPVAACLDSGLTLPDCRLSLQKKSSAPTWVLGIDYTPIDDLLLYAKYSRGYRQGSTNPYGADGFGTFEPEKVDTYEVGVKSSFSQALKGTLNVTGFYSDFSNQQLAVGMVSLTGAVQPNSAIVNAGKSRVQGIEAEASITPFAGLTLNASYAYLDTRLQQLDPILPRGLYNFVSGIPAIGGPLPFAPKNKLSATATYTLPLPETVGRLSVGATYTYTGSYFVSGTAAIGTLPSVQLLNLNLNWNKVAGSPVDAALFATNVTKKKYRTGVLDQTSSGFVSYVLGEPRMYGVRLRYAF